MIAIARMKREPTLHTATLRAVQLALGALPWCVVAPMHRGVATHADGSRVPYGWLDGCADLIGWVQLDPEVTGGRNLSRLFGVEVKAGRDRERPAQRAWRELASGHGGYAVVVRAASRDDVAAAVGCAVDHAWAARAGDPAP